MAVPELMLGSFQMETSEGFDEFMYEMGVNMFTRSIIVTRIIMDIVHWTTAYLHFYFVLVFV